MSVSAVDSSRYEVIYNLAKRTTVDHSLFLISVVYLHILSVLFCRAITFVLYK